MCTRVLINVIQSDPPFPLLIVTASPTVTLTANQSNGQLAFVINVHIICSVVKIYHVFVSIFPNNTYDLKKMNFGVGLVMIIRCWKILHVFD